MLSSRSMGCACYTEPPKIVDLTNLRRSLQCAMPFPGRRCVYSQHCLRLLTQISYAPGPPSSASESMLVTRATIVGTLSLFVLHHLDSHESHTAQTRILWTMKTIPERLCSTFTICGPDLVETANVVPILSVERLRTSATLFGDCKVVLYPTVGVLCFNACMHRRPAR